MFKKEVNLSKVNNQLSYAIDLAMGTNSISQFASKCNMPDDKLITDMFYGRLKILPARETLRIIANNSEGRVTYIHLYDICGYSEKDSEEDNRWMTFMPKRGEIYYVDLGWNMDAEQGGIRPFLNLQNDRGNKYSSTIVGCPITSKFKKIMPTHVKLSEFEGMEKPSIILCEQIQRISKRRLFYNRVPFKICDVPDYRMAEVKYALEFELGFKDLDYDDEIAFNKIRDIKVLEYNMKNKQAKDLIGIWRDKWEELKEYCDSHKVDYNVVMTEYEYLEKQQKCYAL